LTGKHPLSLQAAATGRFFRSKNTLLRVFLPDTRVYTALSGYIANERQDMRVDKHARR